MNKEKIGFVGLGDIGEPMAMRILEAGFPLRVYNRTAAKTQPLTARGAQSAASAAELARECDIVFLCVSDTAAVEQVVFGPGGIAEGGRPGQLVVDLSTIHPVQTQEMAQRLAAGHGIAWVDAPVSGGPAGARAGTLAVMAGGGAEDVERVRPVLMSFAGRVTHMGPVGCGMATKACNQIGSAMPMTSLVASFFRMQIAQGYVSGGLPTPMRMYAQGPLVVRKSKGEPR